VKPGDIILADDDGAIVCPQDLLDEVLPRVRRHFEWEQKTKDELRRGVTDSFKKRVT
jgi:regulator of RNase E activity RraA